MMFCWKVFYDGDFVGLYYALSETAAKILAFMDDGGASYYTGRSMDRYSARKMRL
jgi:hypothetical protein